MKFLPIEAEEHLNARFRNHTQCSEVLSVFTGLYHKVGFNKPWIAYFVTDDSDNIVGGAGFTILQHRSTIKLDLIGDMNQFPF